MLDKHIIYSGHIRRAKGGSFHEIPRRASESSTATEWVDNSATDVPWPALACLGLSWPALATASFLSWRIEFFRFRIIARSISRHSSRFAWIAMHALVSCNYGASTTAEDVVRWWSLKSLTYAKEERRDRQTRKNCASSLSKTCRLFAAPARGQGSWCWSITLWNRKEWAWPVCIVGFKKQIWAMNWLCIHMHSIVFRWRHNTTCPQSDCIRCLIPLTLRLSHTASHCHFSKQSSPRFAIVVWLLHQSQRIRRRFGMVWDGLGFWVRWCPKSTCDSIDFSSIESHCNILQ